jgi:hypothetical protein
VKEAGGDQERVVGTLVHPDCDLGLGKYHLGPGVDKVIVKEGDAVAVDDTEQSIKFSGSHPLVSSRKTRGSLRR